MYFVGLSKELDRDYGREMFEDKKGDPKQLEELIDKSLTMITAQDGKVIGKGKPGEKVIAFFTNEMIAKFNLIILEKAYLGLRLSDKLPRFTVRIAESNKPEEQSTILSNIIKITNGTESNYQWSEPLRGATEFKHSESAIFSLSRSLLVFQSKNHVCSMCGGKTTTKYGGSSVQCVGSCGSGSVELFPRTDPVVITLVVHPTRDDMCLLGRKAMYTKGSYSCSAGFVEVAESLEEASAREVFEETNIKVDPNSYNFFTSQPWSTTFGSQLMCAFICKATTENIDVNATKEKGTDHGELEDAKWFAKEDIEKSLEGEFGKEGCFTPGKHTMAHHMLRAWVCGMLAYKKVLCPKL